MFDEQQELIHALQAAGRVFDRTKGGHHTFRHPLRNHAVTVPHPKKDPGIGLMKAIRKQAGL